MDVIELTGELVAIQSASFQPNAAIADCLGRRMDEWGFEIERVAYVDKAGVEKVSLVGRKGQGMGGLALVGHCDTVPAVGWDRDPFRAVLQENKLYGRGTCDMKGALAAMLVAARDYPADRLEQPLYLIVTSDEEIGCGGARALATHSRLLKEGQVPYGVIGEPTQLDVIHAHKGAVQLRARACGRAAHSSTGKGVNANLKMIPFLNAMRTLYLEVTTNPAYFNRNFEPPFVDWNIGIHDGNTPPNVTAPESICTINFRPMPGIDNEALIERTLALAKGFDVSLEVNRLGEPLYTSPASVIVQTALQITGQRQPKTVPYGTDGIVFGSLMELVIVGPGNIEQAHTVDEWIAVEELYQAVAIYQRFIEQLCLNPARGT